MENIELPYDQRIEIMEFFFKTQSMKDKQDELDQFLEVLTPSLKVRVQNYLFSVVLKNNRILLRAMCIGTDSEDDQQTLLDFASKLGTMFALPEEEIIR